MKQTTKMSRAVGQLEKMYNTLNTDFFNGELEVPIITVQSKPGTWGHCSVAKVWRRKEDSTFEMNIAAEVLDKELEEIIDTLLHEMIHLYCRMHNIKETSRGGKYHNGKFKELAEKCNLVCVKYGQYGWNTVGKGNEKLIEYALAKGWTELMIGRGTVSPIFVGATGTASNNESTPGQKAPSSTRKYICPKCKMSVRATKDVYIICGNCKEDMIKA